MIYLGLIIIIFIIVMNLLLDKKIFSPVVIFSSLFALILILALLRINGIRSFSDKAIYSIELGVIFFALGSIIIRLFFESKKDTVNKDLPSISFDRLNWSFIKVLALIVTLGTMVTFFYSGKLLLSGGTYTDIRSSLLGYNESQTLISNGVLQGLVTYVCGPGLYTLTPIAIFCFVKRSHLSFA